MASVKANSGSVPGQLEEQQGGRCGWRGVSEDESGSSGGKGAGDQMVWNLRDQEPSFGFPSELGCHWRICTLGTHAWLQP